VTDSAGAIAGATQWKPFGIEYTTTRSGASKLLAKMHDTDKEFFNDLFEAKLKYITTRPYWNEPTAKPKLY